MAEKFQIIAENREIRRCYWFDSAFLCGEAYHREHPEDRITIIYIPTGKTVAEWRQGEYVRL